MADKPSKGLDIGPLHEVRRQQTCGACPYNTVNPHAPRPALTSRQLCVLSAIANDWTDKRIAKLLQLSDRQVRREISRMCEILGVSSRIQLVAIALRLGILPWSALGC
ncbi:helix-turn-helix domain-containing protein [Stackebrandtia nassauensis]|uniref:Transcriptional regulator, LuxR family n=1 Tax=Stackebrandtia nassauensis (strain DSM 44728 / CIP 108903 / NRRL B-16338 / NBRC 102104 / LLR-40K-21) TaxID=446470 RepID=D3Q7I1_STANL|nr:helix-turn-helix transcriptional regulator [Stackebrandtia nassauensis]ADD44323.1 transcriptional regulator, LuxR family [Stackebrandtia nassauensis DSM 44728]